MLLRAIKSFSLIRLPPRKKPSPSAEASPHYSGTAQLIAPIIPNNTADEIENTTEREESPVIYPHINTPQQREVSDETHNTLNQTSPDPEKVQNNNHLAAPETLAAHATTETFELYTKTDPLSSEKNPLIQQLELLPSPFAPSFVPSASSDCVSEIQLPEAGLFSHAEETVQALPIKNEIEIMQRKIWVRRPGASATLVTIHDDDLVDTVRDVILLKYANSLGRSIDSPDITLKICSREQANKNIPTERVLGPEEPIGQVLDLYYAGGQTIDEALVIEVPNRRTPKPSPKVGNHHHSISYPYYVEDQRPNEGAREYFPPMAIHSPHLSQHQPHPAQLNGPHLPHSMAVLTTGQLPALPSPGAHSTRKHGRPKYIRQHTSSPTILHSHQPTSAGKSKHLFHT